MIRTLIEQAIKALIILVLLAVTFLFVAFLEMALR